MTQPSYVVGVDLGGTKILSVCLDHQLRVVAKDIRPTLAQDGPDAVIARMLGSIQAVTTGVPVKSLGISAPGPADLKEGVVTSPPNLAGWSNVPLRRLLGTALGIPTVMENDANAAAVAEHRLGAGRGYSHLILVTVGTGLGGGLIIEDKVYHGASGGAGEIGHMQLESKGPQCGCGRFGCLEAFSSGTALARDAVLIVEQEPNGLVARLARNEGVSPDARILSLAAEEGDLAAAAAVARAGRYLGAGLTNLVNIFNPEAIVIGGSLRKLGERYLGPAAEVVHREALRQPYADVHIVEAELGDDAPAIGAALLAAESMTD